MIILSILSLVSLSVIIFLFYKKNAEIKCQIEEWTHCGQAPNIFEQYTKVLKAKAREVYDEVSAYIQPYIHSFATTIMKTLYRISSSAAQESLRLYNFIQGKKTLKNAGTTSLFIRDMAKHK